MQYMFDDYIEIPMVACMVPIVVVVAIVVGAAWAICKVLEIVLNRFI